ncbi:RCO3 glucose transporter [Fusarium circinatum]|uniref:RCO3 glucose transporter n=1 Tax=Fusarium circinatum TaxID=48490 RepID=A0A8H5UD46_FUSCI|nr:RCO3 glucose transporter [Fusarium circinatum]
MAIAMGWQKPDNVAGSSAPAIMVGLFVASGGLLFGYDTGNIVGGSAGRKRNKSDIWNNSDSSRQTSHEKPRLDSPKTDLSIPAHFIAAINGILAMTEFKEQFGKHTNCYDEKGAIDICTKDSSIIVAILSAGTALGALLAAPTGDSLGRRKTLLLAVGIFCVGAIFQVCANNMDMLLVGRFFAGIGVGLISVLVPLYQSEMAPKWIRGTLVCAYQLSITIGLFSASVVNILASKLKDSSAYRIPLGLQLVPAVILTGGLLLLPETPRFLVKKNLYDEAGLSLSRLRRLDITHPALVDELQEMIANHRYELTLGPDSYKDIFIGSPHLGRRTFTGCGLQMLQQLTGINFIMYYSTSFFDGAGVESPYTKSLVINVINVVSTIPGLLVIERWGRRKLLMIGAIGMAGCQLLMASFDTATGQSYEKASQTILITFCAINIFFFAASWGPVVWVVTSEIYPLKVRAKAMSVSTASNWLLNFGIGYSVPFLVGSGPGNASFGPKIFFIWGAFCILAVFFVWCNVYETSKISLEQIDEMYERVNHAWNSKSFEPSWSFQQMLNDGWSPSAQPPAGHELQTTTTASSADTTLGDGDASSITVNQNNNNNGSSPSNNNNNDQNKGPPPMAMANVDFSY